MGKRLEIIKLKLWDWYIISINHKPGSKPPFISLIIFAILFPLKYFYLKMSEKEGYQPHTDLWIINGVKFSGTYFRTLAIKDTGYIFKIIKEKGGTDTDDIISVMRFEDGQTEIQ